MREKIRIIRALVLVSAPMLIIGIVSYSLLFAVIAEPTQVKEWLGSFGPNTILVYILITALGIIIPPIGGSFIWSAMIALVGPGRGLLIGYLVTTPLFNLNFFLGKKFGRPLVKKVVGQAGMQKIDEYVERSGVKTLWFLNVFEHGYFDFISYAAGLTKMSSRDFTIANWLGGIPATILAYVILKLIPDFRVALIVSQLVGGALVVISLLLQRTHRMQKKH